MRTRGTDKPPEHQGGVSDVGRSLMKTLPHTISCDARCGQTLKSQTADRALVAALVADDSNSNFQLSSNFFLEKKYMLRRLTARTKSAFLSRK